MWKHSRIETWQQTGNLWMLHILGKLAVILGLCSVPDDDVLLGEKYAIQELLDDSSWLLIYMSENSYDKLTFNKFKIEDGSILKYNRNLMFSKEQRIDRIYNVCGGEAFTMPWTPLAERFSHLPLILAGPMLRRVEPGSVTVWLALKQARTVTLRIYSKNEEGKLVQQLVVTHQTVRLGDYLHLILV